MLPIVAAMTAAYINRFFILFQFLVSKYLLECHIYTHDKLAWHTIRTEIGTHRTVIGTTVCICTNLWV
mgnify:FL=1